MTDTEKLAELLGKMVDVSDGTLYLMADYLIGKGVIFSTDNNVSGKWIPVTERLPEPFDIVLAYDSTEKIVERACMTLNKEWYGVVMSHAVTHWMPLPEAPKEVE